MKIFVSGSRHIDELTSGFIQRLDNIMSKGFAVIVGDCNGVDAAVQAYLCSRGYMNVTVYSATKEPRNNKGNWPWVVVQDSGSNRHTAKDIAMSSKATHGLMLWDGLAGDTLNNILRMKAIGKPAVVYTPFNNELGKPDEPLREETYTLEGVEYNGLHK